MKLNLLLSVLAVFAVPVFSQAHNYHVSNLNIDLTYVRTKDNLTISFDVADVGPPDAAKGSARCAGNFRPGATTWPNAARSIDCKNVKNGYFSWYFDDDSFLKGNLNFTLVVVHSYTDTKVGPPGMDRVTAWARGWFADGKNITCGWHSHGKYGCEQPKKTVGILSVYQMIA